MFSKQFDWTVLIRTVSRLRKLLFLPCKNWLKLVNTGKFLFLKLDFYEIDKDPSINTICIVQEKRLIGVFRS